MIFRTSSTILLQIFCEIIPNSKVAIKSIIDPDNSLRRNSLAIIGYLFVLSRYFSEKAAQMKGDAPDDVDSDTGSISDTEFDDYLGKKRVNSIKIKI